MKNQRGESLVGTLAAIVVVCFFLFGGIGGCMYVYPKYQVYSMEMQGKAVLAEAESSRQVKTLEAKAYMESAVHRKAADITRAEGIAAANALIAGGLGGPEGYLRFLAIEAMKEQNSSGNTTVVYVPTEAGIPITEAMRFNKPASPAPHKVEAQ